MTVKHRLSRHYLYKTWKAMRQRCNDPKKDKYEYYGGRGIKVCARWDNFENFLSDMGERPSPNHQVDRYPDPDGDYSPSNCRWATREENMRNSTVAKLTIDEVDYIRLMLKYGAKNRELADVFSIHIDSVRNIGSRTTWKNTASGMAI